MRIKLISVGKTNNIFLNNLADEYLNRIKNYANFESVIIPNSKISSDDPKKVKDLESKLIVEKLHSSDFLVLLDEKGKKMSSADFALKISNWQQQSIKSLVFVIGGAYGFSQELYTRSNLKFSMSDLTFPHQIARLIFAEQLYRAFTILKGEKYHHD